jgi:hypothetical protein
MLLISPRNLLCSQSSDQKQIPRFARNDRVPGISPQPLSLGLSGNSAMERQPEITRASLLVGYRQFVNRIYVAYHGRW